VTLETIRVGDIVVHPIYDGTAVLTADMWAGSDWTGHRHLLDEDIDIIVVSHLHSDHMGWLELIHGDGVAILPGVTTRSTPGHTPGHTSTVIASGTERLIVLGDAIHCPAQLTEAEWQFVFDVDAELAVRTRQALLRDAEAPGTVLLPCHFPGMQAARLMSANGSRRWVLGEPSTT
jgi:glyoxylase-like metal-dependent hydrolase (beta-lactamase superfamily II)